MKIWSNIVTFHPRFLQAWLLEWFIVKSVPSAVSKQICLRYTTKCLQDQYSTIIANGKTLCDWHMVFDGHIDRSVGSERVFVQLDSRRYVGCAKSICTSLYGQGDKLTKCLSMRGAISCLLPGHYPGQLLL